MVGKILTMSSNRLYLDADYGYGNWEVKWSKVLRINTQNMFHIGLINGDTYYGKIQSESDESAYIITEFNDSIKSSLKQIIFLRSVGNNFIKNIKASISLGLNLTRAKNLRSFTSRSMLGYKMRNSKLDLTYDALFSVQDSTENIERSDGTFRYFYIFPKNYFAFGSSSLLSSSQQKIDQRWNIQSGIGNFIANNQRMYLSFNIGANRNYEKFTTSIEDNTSWEGLFGVELNLFNTGDLSLVTSAIGYPSITEKGRFRADVKFDIKYDIKYLKSTNLTNKIFVKLGVSANYDNQAALGASNIDYIINTTLGLSWNE